MLSLSKMTASFLFLYMLSYTHSSNIDFLNTCLGPKKSLLRSSTIFLMLDILFYCHLFEIITKTVTLFVHIAFFFL